MFQHDNACVQKVSFMRTWFVIASVEEIDCPAQSPNLNLT